MEVSIPGRASGMCKGPVGRSLGVMRAESQVVGLEQRELESRERERPREEGPCQVIQALSSTFQGPYSMSLRSQRRILSRGLT